MNRRAFILSAGSIAATVRQIFGADPRYRIGYTTNTRGGWESDPFKGFTEAREVGFHWVEAFATALHDYYPDDAAGLQRRIDDIGVRFAAITGGGRGGEIQFEDPARRQAVIENHLGVVRFSRKFGTDHQKPTSDTGGPKVPLKRTSRTSPKRWRSSAAESMWKKG